MSIYFSYKLKICDIRQEQFFLILNLILDLLLKGVVVNWLLLEGTR